MIRYYKQSKACRSKRRYADKREAATVMNLLLRKRGRRGRAENLRTYPCPVCGGWHLTKEVHDD